VLFIPYEKYSASAREQTTRFESCNETKVKCYAERTLHLLNILGYGQFIYKPVTVAGGTVRRKAACTHVNQMFMNITLYKHPFCVYIFQYVSSDRSEILA
jgi:hypothetical protein